MSQELEMYVREEIANIALHALGLFLSLVGFGVLIALAGQSASLLQILSSSIYAATLLFLYLASVLFHTSLALQVPWRKAFETVDHCAIYLLIAGTYTPFLMVSIQGRLGWIMLAVIWALALLGIAYKAFFFFRSDLLSTLAYIAMGWLSLVIMRPLWEVIGWQGVGLLGLGGLFYTVGAIFYVWDHKFLFAHALWHIFVLAGSICHYLTILWFVVLA